MRSSPHIVFPHHGLPVTEGRISEFASDPAATMLRLFHEHGEIAALEEGGQRIHFVFGSQYVRQVLSDSERFHSRFFAIRGGKKSAQRRLTSGLLSMNGSEHRDHRRTVMGPFQKRAIGAYSELITGLTRELIDSWTPGDTVDISAEMTRFMLRLTSSVLFGFDLPELAYRIGALTDQWVELNHILGPAAFQPDDVVLEKYDELELVAQELEAALLEMVRIRRSGRMGFDVLSLLLKAYESESGISDEQFVGHMALMFGAAHLTSAHTLTWTLFLLAQHPDVAEKVYEELLTVSSTDRTPDDLERLSYLDMVLKESMRILPASAYSQRIAVQPVEVGPFSLNPGAIVIFSQLISHHNPAIFSAPEIFDPERWFTLRPGAYEYLPFGAGSRMCIGSALAMLQFRIALSNILEKFRFTSVADSAVNARVTSTMLFPEGAIPLRVDSQPGLGQRQTIRGNIHQFVHLPDSWEERQRAA